MCPSINKDIFKPQNNTVYHINLGTVTIPVFAHEHEYVAMHPEM